MDNKKTWMLTLVFWVWFGMVFPSFVQAVGFEAALGIWYAEPGGGVGYKGDPLDLKNDLSYSTALKYFGRARIELPLLFPNLYLMATPLSYEGTATRNISFTFGNQSFTAGTAFSSTVKMDHYDLALFYGIPFLKQATRGMLNLDVGFNMRAVDFQAKVSQGSNMESKNLLIPVPMLFFAAQAKPLQSLSLEGEIRWIAINANRFYDLIGRVKYTFLNFAFVSAGYRHEEVIIDMHDIKSDVRFSGPLMELGLQF